MRHITPNLTNFPDIGDHVGAFRIVELLGSGGMGVVYRARDNRLGRDVALKVMMSDSESDSSIARFLAEATSAASVDHPNIVPVYDIGEESGFRYIVSHLVPGEDLRTMLSRTGPLTPSRTIGLLVQIADALDAAHDRQVIHRDVKPSNILVKGDGHSPDRPELAYLTDFGIAKSLSRPGDLTATGALVGSLPYAAPEQLAGGAVDPTTDVYGLGCVFFHCLTGRPPYTEDDGYPLMWAHANAPVPDLRTYRPDISDELSRLVRRALAKHCNDRFPSCGQFLSAAERLQSSSQQHVASGDNVTELQETLARNTRVRDTVIRRLFLVATVYSVLFAAAYLVFREAI